jgi:hypothetical protein
MKNHPTHPCINCIYFKACGETTRIMPCNGRITKKEFKEKVEALEYITSDVDTMIDARKNEEEAKCQRNSQSDTSEKKK